METPVPAQFLALLRKHVAVVPKKYRHYPNTEAPHLFTFPTCGRGYAGQLASFALMPPICGS